MDKCGWILLLISFFLVVGCIEEKAEFTINPNGSGKVIYEVQTVPPVFGELVSQQLQPKQITKQILTGSLGVDAWKDISYKATDDGKISFKGTALFADISKLDIHNGYTADNMKFGFTKDRLGRRIIELKFSGQLAGGGLLDEGAPKLTEAQIAGLIEQTKAEYNQSRPLMQTSLSALKSEIILHLPGSIKEVSNFEKADSRTANISLDGSQLLLVMDEMMADDTLLRGQIQLSKEPSGQPTDEFILNEKLFGEKAPICVTMYSRTKTLFDYEAELAEAKSTYEKLLEELAREPSPKVPGDLMYEPSEKSSTSQVGQDDKIKIPQQKLHVQQSKKELEKIGIGPGSPTAGKGTASSSKHPKVISTTPVLFANDVSPGLTDITITFDQPMKESSTSYSWTEDDKISDIQWVGDDFFDAKRRTWTHPVRLYPGTPYMINFNEEDSLFMNDFGRDGNMTSGFQSIRGNRARPFVLVFATKGTDGKPTPIPEYMISKAKRINSGEDRKPTGERTTRSGIGRAGQAKIPGTKVQGRIQGTKVMFEDAFFGQRELSISKTHAGDIWAFEPCIRVTLHSIEFDSIPAERIFSIEYKEVGTEGTPEIQYFWKDPDSGELENYSTMRKYRMRLKFGKAEDGVLPGEILFEIPEKDTRIEGVFNARIEEY